jgi:hypothetical protein
VHLAERSADARNRALDVLLDEARFDAKQAIAEAAEVAVAAGVRGLAAGVMGAVDFDDELGGADSVRHVGGVAGELPRDEQRR